MVRFPNSMYGTARKHRPQPDYSVFGRTECKHRRYVGRHSGRYDKRRDVKTIYIAKMAPRAGLIVGAAGNPAGKLRQSDGDLLRYRHQCQDKYLNVDWEGAAHRSDGGKIR